jgi:hypothetical protein
MFRGALRESDSVNSCCELGTSGAVVANVARGGGSGAKNHSVTRLREGNRNFYGIGHIV